MATVKYRLKAGDEVVVTVGKDKGKQGKILQVVTARGRVLVEKVNTVKRHMRQNAQGGGGIMEKEAPIHISNVRYFCSKCSSPAGIRYRLLDDGSKARACSKCGEILDK